MTQQKYQAPCANIAAPIRISKRSQFSSAKEFESTMGEEDSDRIKPMKLTSVVWLPLVGNYRTFLYSSAIDHPELFDVFAGT